MASGNGNCSPRPTRRRIRSAAPRRVHVGDALAQHLLGQVDAGDLRPGAVGDLDGDPRRAGGHVEDRSRVGGDDGVDHRPPPTAVLAHRQHLGQAVVAVGQTVEEVTGEAVGVLAGLSDVQLPDVHTAPPCLLDPPRFCPQAPAMTLSWGASL